MVPRAAIGPDLKELSTGAEGTLGVVTDVTLEDLPSPEHRRLETLRFGGVDQGSLRCG